MYRYPLMHTCINIDIYSNIYTYIYTYYIHPSSLSLSLSLIWFEGCRSVGAGKCDNEGGQFLGVGKEEECGAHSEYLQGMPKCLQTCCVYRTLSRCLSVMLWCGMQRFTKFAHLASSNFFCRRPLPFAQVLEPEWPAGIWTTRSLSGKTNAIPTELSGRLTLLPLRLDHQFFARPFVCNALWNLK